jgi:F-type H+-transporting ATPase subunit epsilon
LASFNARLVTPESVLFDDEVESVILRDGLGDVTFLAGHSPLVGSLVPGLVRFVRADGDEQRAAAHGGFVHVEDQGRVTVMAPSAELADQIDIERARHALEEAEARLSELASSGRTVGDEEGPVDFDVEQAETQKKRAEVRIEVAGG